MTKDWINTADRSAPWSELKVLVAGLGVSGFASADGLLEVGADVSVVDESVSQANQDKANLLEILDGKVRLGQGTTASLDQDYDLVITSPGWSPTQPLLAEALARSIPVWGDVELAWRLQHPQRRAPWLAVTGTNGKTTTVQMLESMLAAAGLRTAAVGNIGRPVMEAVLDETPYDVLAVELSSFQLHWSHSLMLHSAVVLNVQEDHLEWYPNFEAYAADKAKIYARMTHSCVYNVADPRTEKMVEAADVTAGARAIGFTLGIPGMSMLGVVDDVLVDRAFIEQRKDSALPLANLEDIQPYAPHNVENALAAAALARSFGVPPQAVAQGLRNLTIGEHRMQHVADINGVSYINDSKATNPHAANSSLRAYDSIVWIAGGQAKGCRFDDLILQNANRLRAVVALGIDAPIILAAMRQHAPDVPVIHVEGMDTEVMDRVVCNAAKLAQTGDTVLLAPGCASKDIFSGYDARGCAFAAAVRSYGSTT